MNARATAISLNSIDEKVRSLEGTSRAVPIDMKSLDDRINNLIATAKEWQVINFREYLNDFKECDITSKYGIKLNSNSLVTYKLNEETNGDETKYYFNLKGDFFNLHGAPSQPSGLKRVGNKIYIKSYYSKYFNGTIIILS